MNMNGIMNMVLRVIMRRAINSGINTGMKAVSGKGRKKPRSVAENTGYIEPQAQQNLQTQQPANDEKPTQVEVRERRRAKQMVHQARQQKRAAKDS